MHIFVSIVHFVALVGSGTNSAVSGREAHHPLHARAALKRLKRRRQRVVVEIVAVVDQHRFLEDRLFDAAVVAVVQRLPFHCLLLNVLLMLIPTFEWRLLLLLLLLILPDLILPVMLRCHHVMSRLYYLVMVVVRMLLLLLMLLEAGVVAIWTLRLHRNGRIS